MKLATSPTRVKNRAIWGQGRVDALKTHCIRSKCRNWDVLLPRLLQRCAAILVNLRRKRGRPPAVDNTAGCDYNIGMVQTMSCTSLCRPSTMPRSGQWTPGLLAGLLLAVTAENCARCVRRAATGPAMAVVWGSFFLNHNKWRKIFIDDTNKLRWGYKDSAAVTEKRRRGRSNASNCWQLMRCSCDGNWFLFSVVTGELGLLSHNENAQCNFIIDWSRAYHRYSVHHRMHRWWTFIVKYHSCLIAKPTIDGIKR